jgi:DNA primase
VQKLFRLTDSVVFCFDGDNAGRKAAWRALENTLPALVDGKNAVFLFLPEGEDPDDFVRRRGKAAFEALIGEATPLSEFLLRGLTAQHPPTTAEGRAALVAAARPLIAQLTAPVLSALIRRRLAEMTGLPESELRALLRVGNPAGPRPATADAAAAPRAGTPRPPRHAGGRRAPSLVRDLIQTLLLCPELAREVPMPQPDDGSAEEQALAALVAFCAGSAGPLTTAGAIQRFAGTPHEGVLSQALATAQDHGITPELAEAHLRAGVARWWQQAHRDGRAAAAADVTPPASAEESERLRQLEMVRHRRLL